MGKLLSKKSSSKGKKLGGSKRRDDDADEGSDDSRRGRNSLFRGMGKRKSSTSGNYFKIGSYVTQIVRMKDGESLKDNADYTVAEQRVVIVLDDNEGKASRPGEECSEVWKSNQAGAPERFKGWLKVVTGAEDDSEIDEGVCEQVVSKEQPLKGRFLEVRCYKKTLSKPSKAGQTTIDATKVVRRVPASEVLEFFEDKDNADDKERLFADGELEKLVKREKKEGFKGEGPGDDEDDDDEDAEEGDEDEDEDEEEDGD